MARSVDILVVGGGIAGVSAAARFAGHGEVLLLERESALGYHSSGRSATFYHFGIGNEAVRGLTAASAPFFASPPDGYADRPLWQTKAALFIADRETLPELRSLHAEMARFTDTIRSVGLAEMQAIVPVLKIGEGGAVAGLLDEGGRKLDADLMLHAAARALRNSGGEIVLDAPVLGIRRTSGGWAIDTPGESYQARILINAAGAWADQLAEMGGVRPLGLKPLRRTIIGFAPPRDMEIADWPFLKTVSDDGFYMLPDAGRLLASPMDVAPSPPCDVQPDDYEVALAAWRVEEATTLTVDRISLKWAGLRSFVADKVPTAGFAPDAPGFFWLAGQGGYGLQTSPAMAMAAEALMFDLPWPDALAQHGVRADQVTPDRLFRS
jgi:D-arginine dehydrogenase